MATEMVIHIADCEDVFVVEEKIGKDKDDSQDVIIVKEKMGTAIHESQDVILVEEKMCNPL